jgi:hypothetical protein
MATSSQLDSKDILEMVVVSRDSEPTIKEIMEYWRHVRTLRRCDGCNRHMTCWSANGVSYFPKAVFSVCSNKEVRESFRRLQEMKERKPLGYFAIKSKWFKVIQNLLRG